MTPSQVKVSLEKLQDTVHLQGEWCDLYGRSDQSSVFLTWDWLSSWIEQYSPFLDLHVLRCYVEHQLVGLAVVSRERVRRRKLFRRTLLVVNSSTYSDCDVTIEHNGLLVETGLDAEVYATLFRWVQTQAVGVDELYFPNAIPAVSREIYSPWLVVEDREYFVANLRHLVASSAEYLQSLSANTRSQLRAAMRKYEKDFGELTLTEAGTLDEALDYFSHLKVLHQSRWQAKGKPGAFADSRWEAFHRSLIERRFSEKGVQICRVVAGTHIVGYVYSLIHQGSVFMIQSGLNYLANQKFKPGYVCHCRVIEHNKLLGMDRYDFLIGDNQYKRSLSHAILKDNDVWYRKASFSQWIENRLVWLRGICR